MDARRGQHRRVRTGGGLALAAVTLGLVTALGVGSASGAHRSFAHTGASAMTSNTFVSLLNVCHPGDTNGYRIRGCARNESYTENLSLFSLVDGRRLRTLAQVPVGRLLRIDTPVGAKDGRILLTTTTLAPCTVKGAMECGSYVPDSCRNTILSLTPGQMRLKRLFAASADWMIGAAVLSPNGSQVAYSARPCTGTTPAGGIFVRDLRTGRTRVIVRTDYCATVGQPAWNASGTQVAFPFQPSRGRPVHGGLDMGGMWYCPSSPSILTSYGRDLAIASTGTTTTAQSLKLIAADHGCDFDSVTFDSAALVALEGCSKRHHHAYGAGANLGNAYVVEYDRQGQRGTRIELPYRGLNPAFDGSSIETESHGGRILIAQDQPQDVSYPNYNRVYQLDGTKLTEIRRYEWGSEFLAIPW